MLVSNLPLTCIVMVWTFLCVGVCEAGPSLSSFLSPPRAWRAFGVLGRGRGSVLLLCVCDPRERCFGRRPAAPPESLEPKWRCAFALRPGPAPSFRVLPGGARAAAGRGGAGRSSRDLALYQDLARGVSESVAGGRRCWPVFSVTGALGWRGGRATISNILLNVGEPNDTFKTMTIIKTKCIIS